MKLIALTLFILVSLTGINAQPIFFNDVNFKNALLNHTPAIDTNGDGDISQAEAAAVEVLEVDNKGITDLTGIEYFTGLKRLDCYDNALTSLDVSGLSNLEGLNCDDNGLTSLDLRGLSNLDYVNCYDNALTSLYLSGLSELTGINCSGNALTNLDASGLSKLEWLYCHNNTLTSLDLSGLSKLERLNCSNNALTSLQVNGLSNLERLECPNNELTSLDASGLSNLIDVFCGLNESMTGLDIRGTKLNSLYANDNPALECIVVSDLTDLPSVYYVDGVPFTLEPCWATFEGIADRLRESDLPQPLVAILIGKLDWAESLCASGSDWLLHLTLEGMKQTLGWSVQYGRLKATEADSIVEAVDELIDRIQSGELNCDGSSPLSDLFDRISDWFFLAESGGQSEIAVPEETFRTDQDNRAIVYPNPTRGLVRFSAPAEKVEVVDMVGRIMMEAESTEEIDLSGLLPGVYLVRLQTGKDLRLHRVVKE